MLHVATRRSLIRPVHQRSLLIPSDRNVFGNWSRSRPRRRGRKRNERDAEIGNRSLRAFGMNPHLRIACLIEDGFRDEELLVPLRIFTEASIHADLFATRVGTFKGMLGAQVNVGSTIEAINPDDYDALMIPGGDGTPLLRANPAVIGLAQAFHRADKLLCAICWAPTILAAAGLLRGRRATSCYIDETSEYPGLRSQQVLQRHGAELAFKDVVQDGRIITASGPKAARKFANSIVSALRAGRH